MKENMRLNVKMYYIWLKEMESFLTSSIYHMLRLEVQVAVDQAQRRAGLCPASGQSLTKKRERQAEETERRGWGDGVLLKSESEGKKKKRSEGEEGGQRARGSEKKGS